jgi:hypothetical protein
MIHPGSTGGHPLVNHGSTRGQPAKPYLSRSSDLTFLPSLKTNICSIELSAFATLTISTAWAYATISTLM